MAQPKQARAGLPFIWGIVGFCLIGIIAIAVRHFPSGSRYEETRKNDRLDKLTALRKEEQKKLHGYHWVNKEKGIVQIPIERAMTLALADLKAKGVAPSSEKAEPHVSLIVPPYVKVAAPAGPAPSGAAAASPSPAATAAPVPTAPAGISPAASPAVPAAGTTP
jgi:hypothetical protein